MAEVNLAELREAIAEAKMGCDCMGYECVADERYIEGYKDGLTAAYVIAANL